MPRGKRMTGPRNYFRCANCHALIPITYRICTQCGFNNSTSNRKDAIAAWNEYLNRRSDPR